MTNLDIINQIEKELNVNLKISNKIEYDSKGDTLNQNGQVTGLVLLGCRIQNLNPIISPLAALTNLTNLNLGSNQLSDISPLKALKNLVELDLPFNRISDISPLNDLTNLIDLSLHDNLIRDISPLKNLVNLTELYLKKNNI
ncbi:leucine-rich repeat domain-containing protein, partial [Thermodesulfobacteriota bacterium]